MKSKPIAAITVLLLVVVSLSIAGCTSSTTSTKATAADVNATAKAVDSAQQFGNFSAPRQDDKYVQYNVTFTNINAKDDQVSGYFSFVLLDANKNVYTVEQNIQSKYLNQAFPYGYTTTQPGDKVSGRLVYEVPQDAKLVALRYHDYSGFNVTVPL